MLENFNIVLAQKRGGQKDIAKAAMHYALLVYPYFFLFCSKCLGFASLGFGKNGCTNVWAEDTRLPSGKYVDLAR